MRRVALLTLLPVMAMVAAGCRHDGRTLRDPKPDQNLTISTTAAPTTSSIADGGFLDTVPDTALIDTTAATLPGEELTITAPWVDGGAIPATFTCDGDNVSPSLSWSAAPTGTVGIAVTMIDLDKPDFGHWAISGLPADATSLAEDDVPLGAIAGVNGAGQNGYTGPCPPAGSTHTYVVSVHYLGSAVNLTDGATVAEIIDAVTAAELASAEVTGTFTRT